jgi:hypothetical protein
MDRGRGAAQAAFGAGLRQRFDPWLAGLFLASLGYVWVVIEPGLQYWAWSPVFFASGAFFREHLGYPGGLARWLAALVEQFYRISLVGALTTTALAAGFHLSTRFLMGRVGGSGARWAPLVPAVLLLMAQPYYFYPWMAPVLGMAGAVGCAAAYAALPASRRGLRVAVLCAVALPLYWALGGAYLLFIGLCVLVDARERARWWPGLVSILLGLLLPWLAASFWVAISYRDAYGLLVPLLPVSKAPFALKLLFLSVPLVLTAALVRGLIAGPLEGVAPGAAARAKSSVAGNESSPRKNASVPRVAAVADPGKAHRRSKGGSLHGKADRMRWLGHPALWIGGAALLVGLTLPPDTKTLARIEARARERDWPGTLQAASRLSVADSAAISDVNRALCHSGRLLDDMFRYPQQRGLELWFNLHPSVSMDKLVKGSELLFELGHVNRAERLAGEALELSGYKPEILRRLFYICVLKGYPETALPYLNLLGQTVWYRSWAEGRRQALAADPALVEDPELKQARAAMLTQDYIGSIPNNVLMQASLRQNRGNRMAFQYLIATYLLEGELEKILQNFPRLDDVGQRELPRHVQEAVVIYQQLHPKTAVDLRGRKLDPAILERNRKFRDAVRRFEGEMDKGEARLAAEFGDTYWYYFVYGHSGSVKPGAKTGNSTR